MSLLVVENLRLSFGTRDVFRNESLTVGFRDRIGLVGPNGTGKTTLLRILVGRQHADAGTIKFQRGVRLGYLPQDITELPAKTLLASVVESVPGKRQIEAEVAEVESDLAESSDPDEQMELADRLAELHEMAEHQDAFYSEHEAEKILMGLGFREDEFGRSLAELSGGWKMRAALAALLFQKPDLLLMDEPTNHLDALSVRWLEGFLSASPHAMILISHDREFLDRQVTRILSLEPEGLRSYLGNYSRYKAMRDEEMRVIAARADNQERKRRELERFIDRYRANKPRARQAQSRIKMLRTLDEIDRLEKPKEIKRFTFPTVERTVRDICLVKGLAKRFGDLVVYRDLSLSIQRGDRIAIIGVNGVGKTTLLRIIAGEIAPDAGEARLGAGIQMGYYAQHQTESLRPEATILDEVWRVAPDKNQSFLRGVLGAFLFPGEDVDKRVGVLSGGEKARVALARLLVRPYNFLLMDEPTNHLDLTSAEALAEALEGYEGTLVFVSHNQAFVNRLATKVWYLDRGVMEEYPGNLADFYYHLEQKESAAQEKAKRAIAPPPRTSAPGRVVKEEHKERRRQDAQVKRDYAKRIAAAEKKVKEFESRIARLESRQEEVSRLLADPEIYVQGDRMRDLLSEYDGNRRKLEELIGRWEAAGVELEKARAADPDRAEA
jgi:ATP-binding cassette subfamily F protein 3